MSDVDNLKSSIGWLELHNYTTDPGDTASDRRGIAAVGANLRYWNGTSWVTLGNGTPGSGIINWDTLYDVDKDMDIDETTLIFYVRQAIDGFHLNKTNTGAGSVLKISNAGSGVDIEGPDWNITGDGSKATLELGSTGRINASSGAMTLGSAGTATTFSGTATIAQGLTVSAGGATVASTSNAAATFGITNNTITTYANGMVQIGSSALTTGKGIVANFTALTEGTGMEINGLAATEGTLLKLSATDDGTLTTGKYLDCYDADDTASVFKIGPKGKTTISGNAGSDMLTITAGDIALANGKIALARAANVTVLGVTANSVTDGTAASITANGLTSGIGLSVAHTTSVITTGSVAKISSTSVDTGTGQGTLLDLVSSATVAGLAVKLTTALLETGTAMRIESPALTTGNALYIAATDDGTLTTGKYINCYDLDGTASVFTVGAGGAVATSGGVLSSSDDEGVGYAAGAGGTVTQQTNKSTGVTLNKVSGEIIMNDAELADDTTVSFVVTNSTVAATDVVTVNHASVGTAGQYLVWVSAVGAGSFTVSVRNISGGALSAAIKLNFAVLKAVKA